MLTGTQKPLLAIFTHPIAMSLLAVLVYGSWAAFTNMDHGFHAALMAGLGQGAYAFVSTFTVTSLAQKSYSYFGAGVKGFLFSFIATFLVMLLIPLGIHSVLGTPDVLEAISLGLIWGTGYILFILWVAHSEFMRNRAVTTAGS